ncbi:MAG: peptide-methionine (S)-S-oxide reductase MsrA [Pseudorhodobacter sp.]|nr:peptide-methionine (S)-S-oxide reductase MsrA [Rhizobacter sp.]
MIDFLPRFRRWTALTLLACTGLASAQPVPAPAKPLTPVPFASVTTSVNTTANTNASTAKAIFAGGCFWCVESDFDKVPGVLSTTSGYIGGNTVNPTYEQVSAKQTGHAEAVQIVFDPAKVSYAQLVEHFWRTIDPTTKDRQFCDAGSPYRTAIFAVDATQLATASASRAALEKSKPFKEPVVTEVVLAAGPSGAFYAAEDYHQDYYKKNPVRYNYYRNSCGRDARLKQLWGSQALH